MAGDESAGNVPWVAAIAALTGVALLVTAWRLALEPGLWWLHVAAGVTVVVLAVFTALSALSGRLERALWSAGVNFLAGLVVLAAPWVLGAAGTGAAAVDLVAGAIIAIAAGYNWWQASEAWARETREGEAEPLTR